MNQSDTPGSILQAPQPERCFGQILQEQGKMTQDDTLRALTLAKENGMLFGEAARSLGLISAAEVEQVLAEQFEYHYLQPGEGGYSPELFAAYDPFGEEAVILRTLRSHLQERWFDLGHKVLDIAAVSSGSAGSMLVANIAVSFSQIGMRTLLVDANVRAPKQQDIFNIEKMPGLTDILAGRNNFDGFFNVPRLQNLYVLTTGTLPPNSQELLGRNSLRNLFDSVAQHFDVVLVDSPSFLGAEEAFTIATKAGGVLLLCQAQSTRVSDIGFISSRITGSGAQVVSSVYMDS